MEFPGIVTHTHSTHTLTHTHTEAPVILHLPSQQGRCNDHITFYYIWSGTMAFTVEIV